MNNISKQSSHDSLNKILEMIRELFKNKIIDEVNNDDVYILEIDGVLNRFDRVKLERIKEDMIVFEIGKNVRLRKTILSIWKHEQEIKI